MSDDPVEAAADALFGASFSGFVDERKRLVAALKAQGKTLPAQRLAATARPPLSVWAVNQLWRQAPTEMKALFAAAEKIRNGDMASTGIHREVLADLRERASELLRADGSAANEPTLRRITQTLQALAAAGGFDPDPPGRLTTDRDPPGFESLAGLVGAAPAKPAPAKPVEKPPRAVKKKQEPEDDSEDAKAARAEAQRAKEAAEEAAKARTIERRRLETESRTAERALDTATRELTAARASLAAATERVQHAEAAADEARARAEAAVAALDALDAEPAGA